MSHVGFFLWGQHKSHVGSMALERDLESWVRPCREENRQAGAGAGMLLEGRCATG